MTEYTATCRHVDTDTLRAYSSFGDVVLSPSEDENVCLSPAAARTFARGILALADEIDGGEVPATAGRKPIVGDRVVVVRDDPDHKAGSFVGLIGTLKLTTDSDDDIPYLVHFGDGDHGEPDGEWWCNSVRVIDAPADEPLKVGDVVRITAEYPDGSGRNNGKVGPLLEVDQDDTDFPYTVDVPEYGSCGAYSVERVDDTSADTANVSTPEDPRVALLKRAANLLDVDASGADIVAVARFLAGE